MAYVSRAEYKELCGHFSNILNKYKVQKELVIVLEKKIKDLEDRFEDMEGNMEDCIEKKV